jgi:hypothetical protein
VELAAAEIGVEVVVVGVVVEVVVEVGSPAGLDVVMEVGFADAGMVEVVVGDAVADGVVTNSCDVIVEGAEVVAVLRGVELWGTFEAEGDVVDVDRDPLLTVAPFVLEATVDVVEVGRVAALSACSLT